jgi:adenylylsulfate kinase-like enzyme
VKRSELLETLVENILTLVQNRTLLVTVDGIDAAGKTVLAGELADKLKGSGAQKVQKGIIGTVLTRRL